MLKQIFLFQSEPIYQNILRYNKLSDVARACLQISILWSSGKGQARIDKGSPLAKGLKA